MSDLSFLPPGDPGHHRDALARAFVNSRLARSWPVAEKMADLVAFVLRRDAPAPSVAAPPRGDEDPVERRATWLLERWRGEIAQAMQADETAGFADLVNLIYVMVKRYEDAGLGHLSDYAVAQVREFHFRDTALTPAAAPGTVRDPEGHR